METSTKPIERATLKHYTNTKEYSSETKELRDIFRNEVIIIPYTIYYKLVKSKLAQKDIDVLDRFKKLTYDINLFKKHTAKCYDKNLVSYIKKLYRYRKEPDKLRVQLYDKSKDGSWHIKPQYQKFVDKTCSGYKDYEMYAVKGFKNHPVYLESKQYYENLDERSLIRERYNELDEKILNICKQLWLKYYDKNVAKINPVARDRFWQLARGLIINTINQLYTLDIIENLPELVDETLGRVYEGLMCFFDSNYKIDTFIYSITMSKISAYDRARVKKVDAPELFHNMDDVEIIHDYYGFSNPKLPPVLEGDTNLFLERHKSWNNSVKELLMYG